LAQLQNTEIADAENAATADQGDDIAQDDGDEEWEEEDDLTKNEKDEMAWLSGKHNFQTGIYPAPYPRVPLQICLEAVEVDGMIWRTIWTVKTTTRI